ncbi:MAG TPA: hypothetical protein VNO30_42295 [Kofleriaceae bacterium]|nr:hypothetical protein [Kofleriaceae bacterium]
MRSISLALVSFALAAGCTADDTQPDPEPVARATWYQDAAPILAKRCMGCHQEGGIGPFSMTDYDDAVDYSARMMAEIDKGTMPPFDAREDADCTPRFSWIDDPRLGAAEKDTLKAWIADGFAKGTEAEIPAPPSQELASVTRSIAPVEGWPTSGDRDQFICFVLDPQVTGQIGWMTGMQVNPDIDEVVHHAVITEVFPGAKLDALVAQRGIGKPFDCGTIAQPADFVVHVWTPGNQPMQTQPDIAVPILPGAKLVMQIHYHPAGLTHAPDKTGIDLRLGTQWPKRMYFVTALGNEAAAPKLLPGPGDLDVPRFMIPKNVAEHTEHMRVPVTTLGTATDVRLFSVNPHMHLIGTHISATIERPAARGTDPKTECVANGGWNFDWQRTYQYDAPLDKLPSVEVGDVLDIKCKWNNSIENPFVQRMLRDSNLPPQPIDVGLGEQTTNEMCLEIFGLSIPAPAQPTSLDAPLVMPDLGSLQLNPNLLVRQ